MLHVKLGKLLEKQSLLPTLQQSVSFPYTLAKLNLSIHGTICHDNALHNSRMEYELPKVANSPQGGFP